MTEIDFGTPADQAHHAPAIARHLREGGLIAYPTETVYGFGCALIPSALEALARLKQREVGRPFLLLVRDRTDAHGLWWTESAEALARAFWPGPLTLVLRLERGAYPERVVADGAVAVRATPHWGVRSILEALQSPLTSTSANQPGRPAATSAAGARTVLHTVGEYADVWLLDAGELAPSPPSTIVDCARERPRLVRAGAIELDTLKEVVEEIDA